MECGHTAPDRRTALILMQRGLDLLFSMYVCIEDKESRSDYRYISSEDKMEDYFSLL